MKDNSRFTSLFVPIIFGVMDFLFGVFLENVFCTSLWVLPFLTPDPKLLNTCLVFFVGLWSICLNNLDSRYISLIIEELSLLLDLIYLASP